MRPYGAHLAVVIGGAFDHQFALDRVDELRERGRCVAWIGKAPAAYVILTEGHIEGIAWPDGDGFPITTRETLAEATRGLVDPIVAYVDRDDEVSIVDEHWFTS